MVIRVTRIIWITRVIRVIRVQLIGWRGGEGRGGEERGGDRKKRIYERVGL